MSIALTKDYIEAFNNKSIDNIVSLFSDDIVLEDPVVKRLEGKDKVVAAVRNIFDGCKALSFTSKNIYETINGQTMIEFILILDDTKLEGVDILEWNNDKITELRAYLDVPK
tara:strand:- start:25157 stop:25492 length:336 start_codon:yes stop_codon:yes gene_type:complete